MVIIGDAIDHGFPSMAPPGEGNFKLKRHAGGGLKRRGDECKKHDEKWKKHDDGELGEVSWQILLKEMNGGGVAKWKRNAVDGCKKPAVVRKRPAERRSNVGRTKGIPVDWKQSAVDGCKKPAVGRKRQRGERKQNVAAERKRPNSVRRQDVAVERKLRNSVRRQNVVVERKRRKREQKQSVAAVRRQRNADEKQSGAKEKLNAVKEKLRGVAAVDFYRRPQENVTSYRNIKKADFCLGAYS